VKRIIASTLAGVWISLSGCAVINQHQRVAGWPDLKVVEHHVSHEEMRARCTRFVAPYMSPEGCTLFYLDQAEAHIYVSKDFPSRHVLEHERLHAAGYDHIGSDNMKRVLARWKERQRAQHASN
jgi:hypothetical protein